LCLAGVQIAYFAIIGTQLFMVVLSVVLLFGILKVQKLCSLFLTSDVNLLGFSLELQRPMTSINRFNTESTHSGQKRDEYQEVGLNTDITFK
jgi:hypothetical protein